MNPFYLVHNIHPERMDSGPVDELLIEQSHDLMGLLPKSVQIREMSCQRELGS